MHPTVAIYFGKDSCLVVGQRLTPLHDWHDCVVSAEVVRYSEPTPSAGKALKRAMKIASNSKPISTDPGSPAEWPDSYNEYWNSGLFGTLVRKDNRWIIYCGNEYSPEVTMHLAVAPTDEAAGEALMALRRELERLFTTEA
jgi:hypothetical protein